MINKFIAEVRNRGLARTNRYEVVIPFPNSDNDTSRLTSLFCETASLPGYNIATTPARVYGESREMPYERAFEPITLSFYVDSGMLIKDAFERWMSLVINPDSRTIQYYDSYVKPITIYVDNVDDTSPYVLTLHECYPKTMQAVQLQADGKDIMKLSVTIQYHYWTSETMLISPSAPILDPMTFNEDPNGINTDTGFGGNMVTEEQIAAFENSNIVTESGFGFTSEQ